MPCCGSEAPSVNSVGGTGGVAMVPVLLSRGGSDAVRLLAGARTRLDEVLLLEPLRRVPDGGSENREAISGDARPDFERVFINRSCF